MPFKKIFLIVIACVVLVSLLTAASSAFALQPPPMPAIYSGTVKYDNGSSVASGTIMAYIDEMPKGGLEFQNGSYEYFVVQGGWDDIGKPVVFTVKVGNNELPAIPDREVLWQNARVSGYQGYPNINLTVKEPPAAPTASPAPGAYGSSTPVTLSCATQGAVLYYTTDGSDPKTSTTRVEYGSPVQVSSSITIKAVSLKGGIYSQAYSFVYNIGAVVVSVTPSVITLGVGETRQLSVTTNPGDASVYYSSDNNTVAWANTSGLIKAEVEGSATITVTASKSGLANGSYNVVVTVVKKQVSLTASPSKISLKEGATKKIIATPEPSDAAVTFSTNDSKVAMVDNTGLVKAVEKGKTTIKVTATKSGYEAGTAEVEVTVTDKPVIVTVQPEDLSLVIGDKKQLAVTTDPTGATVKYTSGSPGVATVNSSGLVTAIGKGTAVITVTAEKDGYEAGLEEVRVRVSEKPVFSDVSAGHWAARFITGLYDRKVVSGYSDGTFKPDKNITRAEFIKILTGALAMADVTSGAPAYLDVPREAWYYGSVQAAAKASLVAGYGTGLFKPDNRITRQEIAVIIIRVLKLENPAATNAGVKTAFGDDGVIAPWSRGFVVTAVQQGLITGYPDNSFRPAGYATRAEACAMIYKLLEKQ